MKRLLLLIPITLLLWGFIRQESDKPDYCFPIYETCIDNYFNDMCSEIYRSWNDIQCKIETGSMIYIFPIRTFKCNVCNGNYWMPINL